MNNPVAFERVSLIYTLLAAAVVFFPVVIAIALQAERIIH